MLAFFLVAVAFVGDLAEAEFAEAFEGFFGLDVAVEVGLAGYAAF